MKRRTLIPQQSQDVLKQERFEQGQFLKDLETDVLARTIWGEARGQSQEGKEAVASVIMNRVRIGQEHQGYWWGESVISVCQKPWQFSCWNKDDPNYPKLMAVTARNLEFSTCLRIARRAVYGLLADPTGGATHYHAKSITPYWTAGEVPIETIGAHIFYKLG